MLLLGWQGSMLLRCGSAGFDRSKVGVSCHRRDTEYGLQVAEGWRC